MLPAKFTDRFAPIIQTLRQYGILNILPLWKGIPADLKFSPEVLQITLSQTWDLPNQIKSLCLQEVTLRLRLVWWADLAEVFVNGVKLVEGDLFDQKCRICLGENVKSLTSFDLEVRLKKPKHDRLGFTTAEILIEYPQAACDPGKFAEELEILQIYLPILAKNGGLADFDLAQILTQLENYCATEITLESLTELSQIRNLLLPLAEILKQRKVYLLGNSHIDIAWLWPIDETKEVMSRTFSSALELQKSYPELYFNQSTALSYAWIEAEYPELFEQIKVAIAAGKWEPIGGMWIEPDCNLPSGESLIRQILYGKSYFQQKFGKNIDIAWLPDTFGFHWQLPQILIKSGFTTFITQKLTWNDTNKFPHSVFWWEGLDGSQILTYFSNELGMGIEPVAIAKHMAKQEQNQGIADCLWLFGVGDHGGGVTADMLDLGREWHQSELFFTLHHSSATAYVEQLQNKIESEKIDLPIWQDELYLEFHRGTYTSKADQKQKNRQTEILLTNLEKLYAIAAIFNPNIAYPKAKLETAWKLLLTNQFHDILPGTGIPEVYADADLAWQEIEDIGRDLLAPFQNPSQVRFNDATYPSPYQGEDGWGFSFYLWNSLNWQRNQLIEIPKSQLNPSMDWQNPKHSILQDQDLVLPLQQNHDSILFLSQNLPSLGAATFTVSDRYPIPCDQETILKISETSLENQYLKITIDSESGEISQILDHRTGREILSDRLQLQFFQDQGQYWDAWNIDPDYQNQKLESAKLGSIQVIEQGCLRVTLRLIHQFRHSTFQQDLQLDSFSSYLTIKCQVDWQESHILVKAAFPLSFSADFATYEIPMGAIRRSTLSQTPEAKAKFEVPAQFWADMSGDAIGLSVLNDCKYGYDAQPNCLRLTLLRSPEWPCPDSDRGIHNFSYRLIPHSLSWQKDQIVRQGYEFNCPPILLSRFPNPEEFLHISIPNIMVSAFKQSEDRVRWILRCYETGGEIATATFNFFTILLAVKLCNLLEEPLETLMHSDRTFSSEFSPYEIKTFALQFVDCNP